jgi:sugar phosphate isomerase/epimerase
MTIKPRIPRRLGTMVAYGFAHRDINHDLGLALRMGASCLEILPVWRNLPDPLFLRALVADHGLSIHSAHGCWGAQSIVARRVDLGSTDPETRRASVDDISRCIDWLASAGGRCLVVHPGGLSDPSDGAARRDALESSLGEVADHAIGTGVVICVENMPPGVHPGSRMHDLKEIVGEVGRGEIALALDTGHAHMGDGAGVETRRAGALLGTTHVHDNNARQDVHLPPGEGTIDWSDWVAALDEIEYSGPVMLECIRQIRDNPDCLTRTFLDLIHSIAGIDRTRDLDMM